MKGKIIMITKVKKFFTEDKELSYYADSEIEYIALLFIIIIYSIWWIISRLFLFITCPIWIIPYGVYKKRKG